MKPLFGFVMTWTLFGLVLYSCSWLASCNSILADDGVSVNLDQHNNGDNLPNNLQPFLPDESDGGYIRALLCPDVPLEALPYFRFHLMTRSCYEVGTQGPCGSNMVFMKEPMTKAIGKCVCILPGGDGAGAGGSHRPLLRDPVSNQCYHIYSQAFCSDGQWLTVSSENPNYVHCEPNPCAGASASARAKMHDQINVEISDNVRASTTTSTSASTVSSTSSSTLDEIVDIDPYTDAYAYANTDILEVDLNVNSTTVADTLENPDTFNDTNIDATDTSTIVSSGTSPTPTPSETTSTSSSTSTLDYLSHSSASTSTSTSTSTLGSTTTGMYEEDEQGQKQEQRRTRRDIGFEPEYVLFNGACTKLDSYSEFCDPDQILSFLPGGVLGCTFPVPQRAPDDENDSDNAINQIVPFADDEVRVGEEQLEETENLIHRRR